MLSVILSLFLLTACGKTAVTGDNADNTDSEINAYSFVCVTDEKNPVQGVKLQICTDETCMMQESGEDGVIVFNGEPGKYNIHVYSFPKEYELVSDRDFDTAEKYETYYIRFSVDGRGT